MNIFKKNNEKKTTQKLPMTGKVQKGFRAYCAVIAAATLVCGMSVTAFAASDPITVVNNLSDFHLRTYPCHWSYPAWLRYRSGRSLFEVSRPVSESQRFPDPCGLYHHHLCKGNPDPYYRLREHSYQTGHTWHFRYAPNLKGGANR